MRAVADKVRCSHSAIQQLLESKGWVRTKAAARYVVDSQAATIKRMYLKHTCAQIAERLGITPGQVEGHVKRNGYNRSFKETLNTLTVPNNRHRSATQRRNAMDKYVNAVRPGISYETYVVLARKMTASVTAEYRSEIDPERQRGRKYQVDHIYPIVLGYYRDLASKEPRKTPLPLALICHPCNLQLLTHKENLEKRQMIGVPLKELKKQIRKREEKRPTVLREYLDGP